MKKQTPFYRAAKRFANRTNIYGGCCGELRFITNCGYDNRYKWFFEANFEPTKKEIKEFVVDTAYWMSNWRQTPDQNRQDRIIALLFADLMWQDEHKTENQ